MKRISFIINAISVLLLLCMGNVSLSFAQIPVETSVWQPYYEMLFADEDGTAYENEDENESESENREIIYEILCDIAASPLNLNAITREDLESMMCFNEYQIDGVLNYIERYGPVMTKGELLMIPYLDVPQQGLLSALTYLGEMPPREKDELDSLKYDAALKDFRRVSDRLARKGEVVFSTRVPFYKRVGDGDAYKGSGIKNWIRASYSLNTRVKFGLVAAEDAGEPFFAGRQNYGYDFYSGYLQLQKMGILKKAVVGRYRLKTGLGLVMNNNYSFGKMFSLSSIQSASVSLRPHSSRSEGNYMQGGAAVLRLNRQTELTAFASYRTIDATLTKDSVGIATILKTGYHRTESELAKRHNATQSVLGANVHWNNKSFHLGATALMTHFSLPLKPYTDGASLSNLYRMFLPAGKDFWNIGVEYGYRYGKYLRLEGETATGDCKSIATVNTLSSRINSKLTLMAIQRFYPYKFYSVMGRSFSEGGANQDESGLYLGVNWTPNSHVSFTGYSDIAYFAWPRYLALGSSHSFDNLMQMVYRTASRSTITVRYRLKCRERNGEEEGQLIYKNEHRLRVGFVKHSGRWEWKSQLDAVCCKYKETNLGAMLSGNAFYSAKAYKVGVGLGYFNTDKNNARVYSYEQSTPYNLSYPSFYGNGFRVYSLMEYAIKESLVLNAKLGLTHYFDRDHIGSSYQQINSSTQTDLDIMLRWRF